MPHYALLVSIIRFKKTQNDGTRGSRFTGKKWGTYGYCKESPRGELIESKDLLWHALTVTMAGKTIEL